MSKFSGAVLGVVSPIQAELLPNFLSKFSNFRCHGNRGWCGTNFNCTVKFADPDNPLFGAGMGVASPTHAELQPILCSNKSGWLLWQQGSVRGNLNDTVRLADPETPQFGANSVHVSLKVAELQLLEVARGLNAIFKIFGEK